VSDEIKTGVETLSQTQPPSDKPNGESAPAAVPASEEPAGVGVQTAIAAETAPATDTEPKATESQEVQTAEPEAETKWYAIHVYSGFEQKVLKNIQYRLEIDRLSKFVKRLLVPTHTVVEIKDGKKYQAERNLMPGYVLIEMTPNDDIFDKVSNLAGVAGFVGDGTKPVSLSEKEVDYLLAQTTHRQDKPKTEIPFNKGDMVKIIEGPFAGFTGSVDDIDPQRGKVSVMVSIFGRPTAVELDALQVDRN